VCPDCGREYCSGDCDASAYAWEDEHDEEDDDYEDDEEE